METFFFVTRKRPFAILPREKIVQCRHCRYELGSSIACQCSSKARKREEKKERKNDIYLSAVM